MQTSRCPLRCRWLINAAGLYSDQIDRMLGGESFTITPRRGELIVFTSPTSWRTSPNEDDFIKRVIGVGGDHVMCCDAKGRLVINGVALDEPYLDHDMIYRQKQGFGAPMDEWFREGDFGARCLAAFERSALRKDGFIDDGHFTGLLKDQIAGRASASLRSASPLASRKAVTASSGNFASMTSGGPSGRCTMQSGRALLVSVAWNS